MRIALLAIALASIPGAALADAQVSLTSHIAVERIKPDASGKPQRVLEEPNAVTPGDKLLFTLDYRNRSAEPAVAFVVTDPIPSAVSYAGGESANAVVSVDGGKSFGPLASLSVPGADKKSRPAQAADVTHIRWNFAAPIAAGGGGTLRFEGIVK